MMTNKKFNQSKLFTLVLVLAGICCLTGCAKPKLPPPSTLFLPGALMDNSGLYMCPFTQDEVMAEWTDNAITAKLGSTLGGTAGTLAGQQVLEQAPIIGGIVGSYVGLEIGRNLAIEAAGGEAFIKENSDISFNTLDDMAVYLYVKFSHLEHYQEALESTMEIYPNLKNGRYEKAIMNAPRN